MCKLSSKPSSASLQSACLSEHDQAFILDCTVGEGGDDGFKKPVSAAVGSRDTDADSTNNTLACSTLQHTTSTLCPDSLLASQDGTSSSSDTLRQSTHSRSESIDSGIGGRELTSSVSVNSLKSCDSGLGGESESSESSVGRAKSTSYLRENLH